MKNIKVKDKKSVEVELLLLSEFDSNGKVVATPKKVKNYMRAIFTQCQIIPNQFYL